MIEEKGFGEGSSLKARVLRKGFLKGTASGPTWLAVLGLLLTVEKLGCRSEERQRTAGHWTQSSAHL